jgi:protoporphyrinogen oxidase
MSVERVPVAVLGAGLTGLSTSESLGRRGIPRRVFEKSARVGGLATTREEAGYRFDRTGHLLHVRSDALRAEVLAWLDGDCATIARRSSVYSHGVYTRYPYQANTFGLPPEVAYECVQGFIAALLAEKPARVDDFEQFCLTHFGAGISRHFMLPYNRKLWGVAPSEITAEWCQRFVPLPKLDDVLRGAFGLNDRELGYNVEFLYPRRGIGALARALADRAGPIELERAPRRIRTRARELVFEHETVAYDVLVSTLPLPALLDSFDALPPEIARARAAQRATPLYYLDLALAAPAGRDYHWVYVPEERYPFYRVGCYSEFSSAMAPADGASLYVELCDRALPDLDELLPRVLEGLIEMGMLRRASDVAFARLRHIEHAYVIYDRNHTPALAQIQPFLESIGVISTGRYGGWNYSSMEDALLFGRDAARLAEARLR